MRRMVEFADDPFFPLRCRLVHVQYRSLVADPVGTVARIYEAFGLELTREANAAMAAKVARAPNGGYGANRYQPEEFGIDPERERASVYAERFGVARPGREFVRRLSMALIALFQDSLIGADCPIAGFGWTRCS